MRTFSLFLSLVLAAAAFADWQHEGQWGIYGGGPGQFFAPRGVTFSQDTGYVYVVDQAIGRVQYFTAGGSYLGRWGSWGSGDGEFDSPWGISINAAGDRLYVSDTGNYRVQYFRSTTGIMPASWGQVKALFR
jgi:DNA-binding beta-propeller fold protein YncE